MRALQQQKRRLAAKVEREKGASGAPWRRSLDMVRTAVTDEDIDALILTAIQGSAHAQNYLDCIRQAKFSQAMALMSANLPSFPH